MDNSFIINNQKDSYQAAFIEHGDKPEGTFQNNTETQYLRFERLLKNIEPYFNDKTTIHDVGSGLCDLHNYLTQKKILHTYSGTEIVQEMIDYSLSKYSDITISNRDLLDVNAEKYDFVVLSGTLNIKGTLQEELWKEYCEKLILKMFELSTKAISFNFLTSYRTFSKDDLIYFNPLTIFEHCISNLSRFIILDHSYPLYEVTVTVFHEEFLKTNYNVNAFKKYF